MLISLSHSQELHNILKNLSLTSTVICHGCLTLMLIQGKGHMLCVKFNFPLRMKRKYHDSKKYIKSDVWGKEFDSRANIVVITP